MTQTTVEHLLQQLARLIGSNEPTNIEGRNLQHIQATLKHHRSTSTEEYIIDERYTNFADKFLIKGHGDLAQDLRASKHDFLDKLKDSTAEQRILSYDILSLLLALSDSPLDNPYERKQQIVTQKKQMVKNWNDVVQDEPLEGEHWQNWDDIASEDNEDDDNDFCDGGLDNSFSPYSQNFSQANTPSPSFFENATGKDRRKLEASNSAMSETSAAYLLDHLKEKQYWNAQSNNFIEPEYRSRDSILHDPSHLNMALCETALTPTSSNRRIYIKEVDAIREVLFLLRGYKSAIFKSAKNGQGIPSGVTFHLNSTYALRHLSCQSFTAIMNKFCGHASILHALRRHVESMTHVRSNGLTHQAFSVAISTALDGFEGLVAKLESIYITKWTSDPHGIISLLQLQEILHPSLSCFDAIFNTLVRCSQLVSSTTSRVNARSVATFLLATLFNQAMNAQMAGDRTLYQTMLSVFYQTLMPYSRFLDDWIWNGSLKNDVAGEFFIKRRTDIDDKSPLYWTDGFYVSGIEMNTPNCPLFAHNFTSQVLLAGKSVNIINKFTTSKFSMDTTKQVSFNAIFYQHFHPNSTHFCNDIMMDQSIPLQSTLTPTPIDDAGTKKLNPFTRYGSPYLDWQCDVPTPITNTKKTDPLPFDVLPLFEYEFEDCIRLYIDDLHHFTAKSLLLVLQHHASISGLIQTLSNIYLMLDTDLMHSFCETIFNQMDKKDRWYDHSFINQAFVDACEVSYSQKYMTMVNIKMQMNNNDMNQSRQTSLPTVYKALTTATYLDQISIDYEISWPTNNFIKPQCIQDYNRLLHLLIRIKRAKYVLDKKTLLNKSTDMTVATTRLRDPSTTQLYALRMRMVWFINAFWRYIMTTVLHADTKAFKDQIAEIENADEIPTLHERYIKQIIDKCLLNEQSVSIKKAIIHIMDLVEQLADLFTSTQNSLLGFLDALEQDYIRTSEFITTSLSILGRKGNLDWFDILSTSLSV